MLLGPPRQPPRCHCGRSLRPKRRRYLGLQVITKIILGYMSHVSDTTTGIFGICDRSNGKCSPSGKGLWKPANCEVWLLDAGPAAIGRPDQGDARNSATLTGTGRTPIGATAVA